MVEGNIDTETHLFNNEDALMSFVDEKIAHEDKRKITIICAGHFIIMPNKHGNELIPAIFDEIKDENYESTQSAIGIFPQYTWKIGCAILKRLKDLNQDGKLSLLVNDWQLVPFDKNRNSEQPNSYRSNFYKEFTELPTLYKKEFELNNFDFKKDMFKTEEGAFYLREVGLRDRFIRKIKSYFKTKQSVSIGACSLNLVENGNVLLNRKNKPSFNLTRNWQAGCVGGIAQMLIDVGINLQGNYDQINFINLIPRSCIQPVNTGSEYAIEYLKENASQVNFDILNIFFNGFGPTEVYDFYEFYGREVVSYEFKTKK